MNVFFALADPTRRSILELLASRGRLSASEISEQFPVSPPAISQHLKILREANLVQVEKRAQQRIYTINPASLRDLEKWAGRLAGLWDQRFDALERVIEAEKQKLLESERNRQMAGQTTFIVNAERLEVVMTRVFDAPRELVFQVYTDPDLLPQWWGTRGQSTTVEKMDVRPGGEWRYISRNLDGSEDVFYGVYREVVPPERLVYTFEYAGTAGHEILEIVTLEDVGGQTKVTSIDFFESAEDLQGMVQSGMEIGAVETFERLAELLQVIQKEKR